MNIELTDKETDMLVEIVQNYNSELRGEIASGLEYDLKMELKEEEAVLRNLLEKLMALK